MKPVPLRILTTLAVAVVLEGSQLDSGSRVLYSQIR